MIEGVNTAAENVFIYDRHISTSKLDRFTFDNIKGRAGRMFRHKIGNIYLYNSPPDEIEHQVRIPLFDDDALMAPELLMQLDDSILTARARRRKRSIAARSAIPIEILSRWAEYGLEEIERLVGTLRAELSNANSLLYWKGIPSFDQVTATFGIVWGVLQFPKHGMRSARQVAHFSNVLRRSRSIRGFMNDLVQGSGLAAQSDIDVCFNFMRGAEYSFPQVLRVLNDLVDVVVGEGLADYRVYANRLQNLFLPGEIRALDEYGVPVPVLQKVMSHIDTEDLVGARLLLDDPTSLVRAQLTDFENELLSFSLAS